MSIAKIYNGLFRTLFTFGLVALNSTTYASENKCCDSEKECSEELANDLVQNFWGNVQHQNLIGFSSMLAPEFQGLNASGHYDRHTQIEGLKNACIKHFKIKNLVASRYGETLVISYNFIAKGENITSGPAIDIWHKKKCKWKKVSHSYAPFPHWVSY